jgi:transcriptional regulator with XRE-family HTH domain
VNSEINGSPAVRDRASIQRTQALALEMVKEQGKRVRSARLAGGLTITDLALRAGLHFNTVGRIERGESEANIEQLMQIADALGVPVARLMHFAEAGSSERTDAAAGDYALVDAMEAGEVLGKISFHTAWLKRRGVSTSAIKVIRARGDSMADKINDGDALLVDTAITHLAQDGVYVIEIDGLDYVKMLQRDFSTGGVHVVSFNSAYKQQLLNAEQAAALRISGRVVWHAGEV